MSLGGRGAWRSSAPGGAAQGNVFWTISLFSLNSGSTVISPSFLLPGPMSVDLEQHLGNLGTIRAPGRSFQNSPRWNPLWHQGEWVCTWYHEWGGAFSFSDWAALHLLLFLLRGSFLALALSTVLGESSFPEVLRISENQGPVRGTYSSCTKRHLLYFYGFWFTGFLKRFWEIRELQVCHITETLSAHNTFSKIFQPQDQGLQPDRLTKKHLGQSDPGRFLSLITWPRSN